MFITCNFNLKFFSWAAFSFPARVKVLTSALDSLQVKSSAAVKFALSRSSNEIVESSASGKLYIAHYGPIGTVILQLDDQADEVTTLAFALNSLLYGNVLIVSGKSASAQFATWKAIEEYLDGKGFTGLVHTLSNPVKIAVTANVCGAVQLLAGDGTVQGIFLNQAQFPVDFYGHLLRRVRQSISLTLTEFEAAKIVE